MRLPDWVNDPQLNRDERLRRAVKYHMLRAAAFHNSDGSIVKLSKALGFSANALHLAVTRGGASKKVALAVEAFVGKDIACREQLAPKVFGNLPDGEEHY